MFVFFQISNFKIDAAQSAPAVTSEVRITRGDQEVKREELKVDATNGQNRDRLDLVHEVDLRDMESGKYELTLHVQDQLSGQQIERRIPFQVAKP
ncbi:MAG: hypothetical protein HYX74_06615 [Acidobacteria bacterium]|nr:hypothetical protein [Acidobacteriota bacterium]